jgi:hypothetical protein
LRGRALDQLDRPAGRQSKSCAAARWPPGVNARAETWADHSRLAKRDAG